MVQPFCEVNVDVDPVVDPGNEPDPNSGSEPDPGSTVGPDRTNVRANEN